MSDYERDYPSTETTDRLRKTALFYFCGGILLAIIQLLARQWIVAVVAGIIICAVGIGWTMANNPVNRKTGFLIIAVSFVVILSKTPLKLLTVVMGTLLSIITVGFLVFGVKNLVKYFIAQNKRP